MRYSLSVDFDDDEDIGDFLEFVRYHTKRLKCDRKDVFIRLASEWKKQQETPVLDLSQIPPPTNAPEKVKKKRTTRRPYKDDEDTGLDAP